MGEDSDRREALDKIEIRIWEPLLCTHGRGAMTRLYSNVVSAGETEIEKALAFSRRAPVATAKGWGEAGRAAGRLKSATK